MQRLRINEDIKPLSEVRTGIANFIKQIQETKRPLVITQHGKGVAVLVDAHEFEAMQEKIELLTDVHTALQQIENEQEVEHKEALKSVLQRTAQ
ncbi:MAG: type II toxin-antitoxin system Phd/YefM family antitoxin [Desulfobulbaceae bacterium]|nr:type II toxin-antitoxin system Phd/YefM family antitoxin [Desulfobulbaceae bacterium]